MDHLLEFQEVADSVRPLLFSPSHLLGVLFGAVVLAGLLVGLWTWFAQFLAPALGQPVQSLHESATTDGFSLWILVPLVVAIGGWGFAYWLHTNPRRFSLGQSEWGKTLYVLFLNKLYFDEIYEVYVVQPTLRLATWLWRTVDLGGIDRVVTSIAVSIRFALARWLVEGGLTVELIGIVVGGWRTHLRALARWLWHVIDIRGIEKNVERLAHKADATGEILQ